MKDNQAEYGYSPTWALQREKQEQAAANAYQDERDCPDCANGGDVHVVGHELFRCFQCGQSFGAEK